jgi:hypothetical protein
MHFAINADDVEASRRFYSALFPYTPLRRLPAICARSSLFSSVRAAALRRRALTTLVSASMASCWRLVIARSSTTSRSRSAALGEPGDGCR